MPDIKVGTPVIFRMGDTLVRQGKHLGSGRRVWIKFRDGYPRVVGRQWSIEFTDHPRQGFIIGQRTCSNGEFTKGWSHRSYEGELDGEPDVYQVTETFQVYLVVESLRGAPVKIRVEDVEVTW